MPRPLLPPRGIFVSTRLLFDRNLSPSIKDTLLQLMALAWGSESHFTPPLSYPQLEHLTGKDARTLRGHFAALRAYHAALRLQRAGDGMFIAILAGWLYSNDFPLDGEAAFSAAGRNLQYHDQVNHDHLKEEEEYDSISSPEESLLPPESLSARSKKQPEKPKRPTAISKKVVQRLSARQQAESSRLSAEIGQALLEAGLFPSLLAEVAGSGYAENELRALLEWCREDQPERPAGLFMGRLRAGARPPETYLTPPCPRCGLRGKHSPECPRRYSLDAYDTG